jgi:hypothetical protein
MPRRGKNCKGEEQAENILYLCAHTMFWRKRGDNNLLEKNLKFISLLLGALAPQLLENKGALSRTVIIIIASTLFAH